ncbi:hypothetical protein N779_22755 [Vibrio coralliilyticus OCN008]|nr:hypothetical protein N779_22755 [Vibrio coralliilyticus OCN008]
MVQQGRVLIWVIGSAPVASFIALSTWPLDPTFKSLVKRRFGYFVKANLPFASSFQVKFILRQLADSWLRWGGPSLFQLALSLSLGFFFGLYWVAAYWFVVFSGHNESMLCGDCIGCFKLP